MQCMKELTNKAISQIGAWMDRRGLKLAPEITECVLLAKRRCNISPDLKIGDVDTTPGRAIKYLGVWFDEDCRIVQHVQEAVRRARKTCKTLARIMPNMDGTSTDKRMVQLNVAYSVMLYGAPIWHEAIKFKKYRQMLQGVQRRALIRVARAYRTVSTEALAVILGTPPIKLSIKARKRKYREPETTRKEIEEDTMEGVAAKVE